MILCNNSIFDIVCMCSGGHIYAYVSVHTYVLPTYVHTYMKFVHVHVSCFHMLVHIVRLCVCVCASIWDGMCAVS